MGCMYTSPDTKGVVPENIHSSYMEGFLHLNPLSLDEIPN